MRWGIWVAKCIWGSRPWCGVQIKIWGGLLHEAPTKKETDKKQERVWCHRSKERTTILGQHTWVPVFLATQRSVLGAVPRAHGAGGAPGAVQHLNSLSPRRLWATGDRNCVCHLPSPKRKTSYQTRTFKDSRKRGVRVMLEHYQGYWEIKLSCTEAHTIRRFHSLQASEFQVSPIKKESFNKLPSYSAVFFQLSPQLLDPYEFSHDFSLERFFIFCPERWAIDNYSAWNLLPKWLMKRIFKIPETIGNSFLNFTHFI